MISYTLDGVHFIECKLVGDGLHDAIQKIQDSVTQIHHITFKEVIFDVELARLLVCLVQGGLASIQFVQCQKVPFEVLEYICKHDTLRVLKIQECDLDIPIKEWKEFLGHAQLHYLSLVHVVMSSDHWSAIQIMVPQNKSLGTLQLVDFKYPQRYQVLKTIIESNGYLQGLKYQMEASQEGLDHKLNSTDEQIDLINSLCKNHTLKRLEWNDLISKDASLAFANMFKDNNTIEVLGLYVHWSKEYMAAMTMNTVCTTANIMYFFPLTEGPNVEPTQQLSDYFHSLVGHTVWLKDNVALQRLRDVATKHVLGLARKVSMLPLPKELQLEVLLTHLNTLKIGLQDDSFSVSDSTSETSEQPSSDQVNNPSDETKKVEPKQMLYVLLRKLIPYKTLLFMCKIGLNMETIGQFDTKSPWSWTEMVRQAYRIALH